MTTVTSTAPARPHCSRVPPRESAASMRSRPLHGDASPSARTRRRDHRSAHDADPVRGADRACTRESRWEPTNGIDYMTFVATGTIGLLVPISCMFAGIGVLVDRETARAATCSRRPSPLPVDRCRQSCGRVGHRRPAGRRVVRRRTVAGADFNASATGIAWFVAASCSWPSRCTAAILVRSGASSGVLLLHMRKAPAPQIHKEMNRMTRELKQAGRRAEGVRVICHFASGGIENLKYGSNGAKKTNEQENQPRSRGQIFETSSI